MGAAALPRMRGSPAGAQAPKRPLHVCLTKRCLIARHGALPQELNELLLLHLEQQALVLQPGCGVVLVGGAAAAGAVGLAAGMLAAAGSQAGSGAGGRRVHVPDAYMHCKCGYEVPLAHHACVWVGAAGRGQEGAGVQRLTSSTAGQDAWIKSSASGMCPAWMSCLTWMHTCFSPLMLLGVQPCGRHGGAHGPGERVSQARGACKRHAAGLHQARGHMRGHSRPLGPPPWHTPAPGHPAP